MSGAIVAAAIGAGVSLYQGQQQKRAANDAAAQAQANAAKQEKAAEEATNRANQKKADPTSLLSAAQSANQLGAGSTMLTGTQGVNNNSLNLGKNTLLGQ